MLVKPIIKRDILRRRRYIRQEKEIKFLKWALCVVNRHPKCSSLLPKAQLDLMLRKSSLSKTRIRNFCNITGKSRAVNRAFRMTRMSFKEQVEREFFTGVTQFPFTRR